jgi:hypothetical protein
MDFRSVSCSTRSSAHPADLFVILNGGAAVVMDKVWRAGSRD